MTPAQPTPIPPNMTPQQANTRAEELRAAGKLADEQLSTDRQLLDDQARARNYRGVAKTAETIAARAKVAAANTEALDKLQMAINEAKAKHG